VGYSTTSATTARNSRTRASRSLANSRGGAASRRTSSTANANGSSGCCRNARLAENFLDGELDVADGDVDGFGRALSEDAAVALGERIDHPCSGECRAPEARFPECTVYSTTSR
jgi:hypothetical protein